MELHDAEQFDRLVDGCCGVLNAFVPIVDMRSVFGCTPPGHEAGDAIPRHKHDAPASGAGQTLAGASCWCWKVG